MHANITIEIVDNGDKVETIEFTSTEFEISFEEDFEPVTFESSCPKEQTLVFEARAPTALVTHRKTEKPAVSNALKCFRKITIKN